MISLVLREGRIVCILFLLPTFIFCYSRYSNAVYERIPGHRLNGYVTTTISVSDVIDCSMECLVNTRCKSYNYKHKSPYTCELNNKTKALVSVDDFDAKKDYSYYEICPCLNGTRCLVDEAIKDFRCMCEDSSNSSVCENYITPGSRLSNPGISCKHIKDSVPGVTDGPQWIDPTSSGTPFKAYCDMTTDGGGWTVVTNYIIPSSESQPSLFVATSIPGIANYTNKDLGVITATTLQKLQDATSFKQMRFHCYKDSVDRTVHIITALNATGLAVVNYFKSLSLPHAPNACGSFYKGPGDNSLMSNQCSMWSRDNKGLWTDDGATASGLKINAPFYIPGQYHFVVQSNRLECDDYSKPISAGDFWNIYVR